MFEPLLVGRGCRQCCRVNALTLLPVSPGLMLLAVCDWHGALMCSPSWCSSWLRRAKLSCSPCWGCMDAEGSRKAKCPAAVSLGFSEVEVGGSSVSWGCPGCAKGSPRTSSLCFGFHAIVLVSPKGESHQRSFFLVSVLVSRAKLSCAAPSWTLGLRADPPSSTLGVSFGSSKCTHCSVSPACSWSLPSPRPNLDLLLRAGRYSQIPLLCTFISIAVAMDTDCLCK